MKANTPRAVSVDVIEVPFGHFEDIRRVSHHLAATLSPEDQCIQSMPDISPVKWHLAHTTWFFETVVLRPYAPAYRPFDDR